MLILRQLEHDQGTILRYLGLLVTLDTNSFANLAKFKVALQSLPHGGGFFPFLTTSGWGTWSEHSLVQSTSPSR